MPVANISTLEEFRDHCLRRLGAPVVDINVDQTQVDEAIREALELFWEEHMDGTKEHFLVKEITSDESDGQYLDLSGSSIYRVRSVIPAGSVGGVGEWHTVPWQVAKSAATGLQGYMSIRSSDFMLLRQRLKTLNKQFSTPLTFRHSKYDQRLELDFRVSEGDKLAIHCYENLDPENGRPEVWNDVWFQRYATAQIKLRWGQVLVSLQGVTLPGNLQIDGRAIYETAQQDIEKLEEELRGKYQRPLGFLVG